MVNIFYNKIYQYNKMFHLKEVFYIENALDIIQINKYFK